MSLTATLFLHLQGDWFLAVRVVGRASGIRVARNLTLVHSFDRGSATRERRLSGALNG